MKLVLPLILLSLCTYAGFHFKTSRTKEVVISWGLSARQGKRLSMEDEHTHELGFGNNKNDAFFAIYDGHGGPHAAHYAANNLHLNYLAMPHTTDIVSRIIAAYEQTDKEILHNYESGSTALSVYIKDTIAYLAWAGDSRGMIIRDGKLIFITHDHKPDVVDEKKRIEQLGQQVKVWGVPRVLGLAVSRALGDKKIKAICSGAVIPTPDVKKVLLKSGDIIVLACDGVWDVVNNNEAASLIYTSLQLNNYQQTPEMVHVSNEYMHQIGNNEHLQVAANTLRDYAFTKGSTDNISVMVIQVQ